MLTIVAPALCVATMVAAGVACGLARDWNKCVFWFLDAGITAWSAFMLR